eukprot:comp23356_c3_seq1/m.38575 comp23356_c3_seq1/g.38575  ORF comp23356_c3_seq1/g.38575 comp23356_c3_seq1/m.38575 type:complete len:380 (-) comp23356_c3_seq1:379-1518(-)
MPAAMSEPTVAAASQADSHPTHHLNANAKAFVPSNPLPRPPAQEVPVAKPQSEGKGKHNNHHHGHHKGHKGPKEGDKEEAKEKGGSPRASVGSGGSEGDEHKRGRQRRRYKSMSKDDGSQIRRGRSSSPAHPARTSLEKAFAKCRKALSEEDAVETIREVLTSKAIPDVNELGFLHNASSDGQTLLMVACKYGRHDTAKMLLEDFGADVNVAGGLGHFTALHYAAWHQHPGITLMLLQHGADWAALNDDGETPAGAARGLCYDVIKEWIMKPQCPIKKRTTKDHSRHPHPVPVVSVLPGQPIPLGAKPLFLDPDATVPTVPTVPPQQARGRNARDPATSRSRSLSPNHYRKRQQKPVQPAKKQAPVAAEGKKKPEEKTA